MHDCNLFSQVTKWGFSRESSKWWINSRWKYNVYNMQPPFYLSITILSLQKLLWFKKKNNFGVDCFLCWDISCWSAERVTIQNDREIQKTRWIERERESYSGCFFTDNKGNKMRQTWALDITCDVWICAVNTKNKKIYTHKESERARE